MKEALYLLKVKDSLFGSYVKFRGYSFPSKYIGAVRYVDGMRQIRLLFWLVTESIYAGC